MGSLAERQVLGIESPIAAIRSPREQRRQPTQTQSLTRALRWLVERSPETLEPGLIPGRKVAAFNLTVLCHLIGTSLEPAIARHELLVEEVAEQMYRIDRCFAHLSHTRLAREISGLRLALLWQKCIFEIPMSRLS
jgi:muramoyltetrapeptide carboxypeptidase LdcA involved in peptidoglycan recycling